MHDVSLYGHLTFDRLFVNNQKDASVGSMGNVWKHLNLINPNLEINLEPTAIGEALIMINTDKCERSSVANLNLKQRTPLVEPSRWNHILYLNELPDDSFIPEISGGKVSADLCRGQTLANLEILKYVDFLFISDEDLFMEIPDLHKYVKGHIILHYKSGSICYTKDGEVLKTEVDLIENVNVLGCGDMFAAAFINAFLCRDDLRLSIRDAHDSVSHYLKGKQ